MSNEALIIILLVVLVVGALPSWPYSRGWGYGPTGLLGLILVVLILWALLGARGVNPPSRDLQSEIQSTGEDLKEMGRDAADAIRNTLQ